MPKAPSERPKVNLDAVLVSRYPDFELGGITFSGRPIGWTVALEFDGKVPAEQFDVLLRALKARATDPELVTDAWVDEHLTRPAVELIVGILFRGERPAG
ncbi:hypothetical protein [Natronococcus sp.]|uniref:hypothetical protein n=1 Tax=Natronococcus sp. TaxID=35747 RepID=UPI003A4DAFC5